MLPSYDYVGYLFPIFGRPKQISNVYRILSRLDCGRRSLRLQPEHWQCR
jgi:hypothetical protein